MSKPAERCWYCRERRAVLWCDYMLGALMASEPAPRVEPEQVGLFERPDPAPVLKGPGHGLETPETARTRAEHIETCDAAACERCAREHGWRRVGHVCARPVSKSSTIDHCHVHAGAGGLGSSAWIGGAAIEMLRRDVRAACVRASIRTCPNDHTSGGPTS